MVTTIPLELDTHFDIGKVNAFLVIGKTITLVDTGNPGEASYQQLKSKLNQHGVKVTDLDQIVLTHIHVDHAGAVSFLQEEADLPIYVHEQARSSIHTGMEEFAKIQHFFTEFIKTCGADPLHHIVERRYKEINWRNIHFVTERDVIPIGGQPFEVVYVPGHSQSDILLWNQETGDAFSGDHLMRTSVNAFIEPPDPGETERPKPLLQYRDSLKKVSRFPLRMVYPGHGERFTDHVTLINKRLQEQEKRCGQILHILSSGEKCIYEICTEMYPKLHGRAVFLGLSQIQGHLDLLEQRQQVSSELKNTVMVYRAT